MSKIHPCFSSSFLDRFDTGTNLCVVLVDFSEQVHCFLGSYKFKGEERG